MVYQFFTELIVSRIRGIFKCKPLEKVLGGNHSPEQFPPSKNHLTISPSLKGSPHSAQNLGGLNGSAGSQPHLSHRYRGAPAGLGLPHSAQNLPLFTAPQEQVQPAASAGLGLPHSAQNFPVLEAPQEQVHEPAGAGLDLPQLAQKLPVLVLPQEQVHEPAAGAEAPPILKRF